MRKRKADLRAAGPAKNPVSAGRKEKMKERARQRKAKKRGDVTGAAGDDEDADAPEAAANVSGAVGPLAGRKRSREAEAGGESAAAPAEAAAHGRSRAALVRTDEFPTDSVAFGERAMAPPTLAVIPRAKVRTVSTRSRKRLPLYPPPPPPSALPLIFPQHTREEAARRAAIARPAHAASLRDGDDDSGEDAAEVSHARREELRRAHFAQYKAQVLTAYAEMKRRRIGGGSGGGVATGALVAPTVASVVRPGGAQK